MSCPGYSSVVSLQILLQNSTLGNTVDETEGLMKRHEAFEKLLGSQEDKVLMLLGGDLDFNRVSSSSGCSGDTMGIRAIFRLMYCLFTLKSELCCYLLQLLLPSVAPAVLAEGAG